MTTHGYLHSDGTILRPNIPSLPANWLPNDGSDTNVTPDRAYNNGQQMWEKFVAKYSNMFLVLCGHIIYEDIVTLQTVGDNGNTVTQMLINPQSLDGREATGMVAMLYFAEDGKSIEVEYYSTVRDEHWKQSNQFVIQLTTDTIPAHTFDQKVMTEDYIKFAVEGYTEYYYSCSCGRAGTEIFAEGVKPVETTVSPAESTAAEPSVDSDQNASTTSSSGTPTVILISAAAVILLVGAVILLKLKRGKSAH